MAVVRSPLPFGVLSAGDSRSSNALAHSWQAGPKVKGVRKRSKRPDDIKVVERRLALNCCFTNRLRRRSAPPCFLRTGSLDLKSFVRLKNIMTPLCGEDGEVAHGARRGATRFRRW